MKHLLYFLAFLLTAQLTAQTTFCGRLVPIDNNNSQLIFAVELQGNDETFDLGTSNIQLGFDPAAYSNPQLVSHSLTIAPFPVYRVPTVTEPEEGQLSLNIELNVEDFGDQMSGPDGWSEIARISLDKLGPETTLDLSWTYDGGTRGTVIFDDNGVDQDQIFATELACLENIPAAVLPITYARPLAARPVGKTALLDWATAEEVNNRGFHIQHSTDGAQFTTIGFVPAGGRSSTYEYLHETPSVGVNYYRLQQEDLDGTTSLSVVREVTFTAVDPVISISPNPTADVINISGLNVEESISVRLSDINGRLLLERYGATQLDVRGLATGTYVAEVQNGDHVVRHKVIIRR